MNASAIAGVAMAAAAAVPASFPKEAHDQPLNKDQFPATAYVNLCRAGYTTLGKLATATTAELLAIPGIGQQKVRHIDMVLALAGLRRSGSYRPSAGWGIFLLQVAAGSALLAVFLLWASTAFPWVAWRAQPWLRVGALAGVLAVAAAIYFVALALAGVKLRQFVTR